MTRHRGSSLKSNDLSRVMNSPRHEDVSSMNEILVSVEPRRNTQQCNPEDVPVLVDGPDTSSFTAFLYSFLSPGRSEKESEYAEWKDNQSTAGNRNKTPSPNVKEKTGKKGLISRGKQSIGKVLTQAVRFGGGYRCASGKVLSLEGTKEGEEVKCMCVNPGRLARVEGGGHFVELNFHINPDFSSASVILQEEEVARALSNVAAYGVSNSNNAVVGEDGVDSLDYEA
ncbi:hypothetical protein Tco_0644192 [Tanacetum coccineum]